MLLEIPNMAICEFEMRRKLLSRSFHYQLKQNEKVRGVLKSENMNFKYSGISGRPSREHSRTRGRCIEGHAGWRLEEVQRLHRQ